MPPNTARLDPVVVAAALVAAMSADNSCHFRPSDTQMRRLVDEVRRMQDRGCAFTDHECDLLAAGEVTERDAYFLQHYSEGAYKLLCMAMNDIFNNGGQ